MQWCQNYPKKKRLFVNKKYISIFFSLKVALFFVDMKFPDLAIYSYR